MEQLDCSSSGTAVRKARGSKRSKDSKYRSSLPRKVEQPDIFSDETLFDTVDTTTKASTNSTALAASAFSTVNDQSVVTPTIGDYKRINLAATPSYSVDQVRTNSLRILTGE